MSFADGVVNAIDRYKRGFYFSPDFVGDHSWNGFERNLLFESIGNQKFTDVARAVGVDEIQDSRAVAVADLDRDGRLDLVMQNNNGPPTLYLNRSVERGHHLQISLVGDQAVNRDAIGARVELEYVTEDQQVRRANRWVEAGNGYASQSQSAVHFGLGSCQSIQSLVIHWPDGTQNRMTTNLNQLIDESVSIRKRGTQVAMQIRGQEIRVASLKNSAGAK